MDAYIKIIANALSLMEEAVKNTLRLLDEGATIPFIARYRKERTGGLDEVQITQISDWNNRLKEMSKRKETMVKTITEQGKMTPELQRRIEECWNATELEDIYLPYRPKRRTRAQMAREKGLEPLAHYILQQRGTLRQAPPVLAVLIAQTGEEAAVSGAMDIIAEQVSENEGTRNVVRGEFQRFAVISSKAVKTRKDSDEAAKYSDYFDFSEPLRRCSSHRLLAMRRGENEGVLRVSISVDEDKCIEKLKRHYVHGVGDLQKIVSEAVEDSYKRLLKPSIENEFAASSKEKADEEAIKVFSENLRQLLLAAPLGQKRVMAFDPGYANGCKIACLNEQGGLLHHEIIYPHPPKRLYAQATVSMMRMIKDFRIEAIAIGNGTASRESQAFVKEVIDEIGELPQSRPQIFVVSEDGASIYSASKLAREEFPDEDVTVRGAVSIGRRLMDPLSELVKIDPKNIGVGQYQHDVDQAKLKHSLDLTVESCVNLVGVNLNTASTYLLMYISGLGPALAKNIVDYRTENGPFSSRAQLKKVPRLGAAAFQQCAGFLRIPGADNPLDNSAVHPESYGIVEQMAKDQQCTVKELIDDKNRQKNIQLERYITVEVGMPTLLDIRSELEKPGRDPRRQIEVFEFDPRVKEIDDLEVGMELPGIVTNITNFGAFVDIGVHQDGLVHVSQLADRFVRDPSEVVKLHQHVKVRVIAVDERRKRIGLSMKQIKQ
ncbi:Tex family protein [Prevotella sp. KH2C16]|uniref:Tex family protein n=1 Tax=Prevotella sp. KH2C16 TaxID=1855325 RepID=UPI0008EB51CA|nr:Tex family protein [Prevotella sp. KH2C16]SFG21377.1 uncharacterized protein SAMN05216383_10754 [Prevotella sp. KH2C16]